MRKFIVRAIELCPAVSAPTLHQFRSLSGLGKIVWILATGSLILSLSFVVSTGPIVQDYATRLLKSDAASIYGSAYQNGLALFPSLRTWLEGGLHGQFLLVSLIIVCASLYQTRSRQLYIAAAISSFSSLMSLDLLHALIARNLSAELALENLLANFIGALIIALIFTSLVILGSALVDTSAMSINFRKVIASFVTVLIGLCICVAAYYITEFLYRPIPVRMDAILDAPTNGVVGVQALNETQSPNDERRKPLFLIPGELPDGSSLRWKAGFDHPLSATWSSLAGNDAFSVVVEVVADCAENDFTSLEQNVGYALRFPNASNLSITLNKGMAEFASLGRRGLFGPIDLSGPSLAMFSMDRDTEAKKVRTTLSIAERMIVTHHSSAEELSFYLNGSLYDAENDQIVPTERSYKIAIDGKAYSISSAKRTRSTKRAGKLDCRSVRSGLTIGRDGTSIVSGAEAFFGVRVRIIKNANAPVQIGRDSMLKLDGHGGWLTLTQPNEAVPTKSGVGRADFLAFKGNIANLDVGGAPTSTRLIDEFHAFGEFDGRIDSAARVRITGEAKALWKNATRVNTTKWEQLSEAIRLSIIGALSTALLATIAFLWRIIQRNDDVDWRMR